MLSFSTKTGNKFILLAPILLGVYIAVLFLLQSFIYDIIYLRFGIEITNSYPVLTLFGLFIFTVPLAIGLIRLLSDTVLSYDNALLVGLASNYSFSITLAFYFTFFTGGSFSIFEFLGILLFAFLFGFIVTALIAMVVEKMSLKN